MTLDIALVLVVLAVTAALLVTERLRVDVVAMLALLAVAWLGFVTPAQAFSGLASNAVVAVIAVMILSYGLDRSGITRLLTAPILRTAGRSESRLITLMSAAAGVLSGFMQNIGAAALFLPALVRLSRTEGVSLPRTLMPVGFAAILGGCLTMVASGPLIILNDLLRQRDLQAYGFFAVTPIGIVLLAAGIAYFLLLGRRLLPRHTGHSTSPQQELIDAWGLPATISCFAIPEGSPLIGKTLESANLWEAHGLHLLALEEHDDVLYAPWRHTPFTRGQQIALLGSRDDAERFATQNGLQEMGDRCHLGRLLTNGDEAGFAELVVHPRADIRGRTLREIALRKTVGVEPILLLSSGSELRSDFSDVPLSPGDTLVVFGPWATLAVLQRDRNFVPVSKVEGGSRRTRKPLTAVACFVLGIGLAVSGIQLSLGLFSGALAMILLGVITIDEAYRAIDWRTVFLLAGLIPLGIAMESTGTAAYIAQGAAGIASGSHPFLLYLTIAILATVFSLLMSNVAATVVLVPLTIAISTAAGLDPRPLALLVAICASNSFVLPTHQVNALFMGPGGYRTRDYLKVGSLMSVLFLLIAVSVIHLCYR